jgi:hypothetical protein
MYNFDNVSLLGENDTLVKDLSGNGFDLVCGKSFVRIQICQVSLEQARN